MSPKARLFWIVFVVCLAVDQATKLWVYTQLDEHGGIVHVIPGFLDIVHAENPGAAFSMFRNFAYRNVMFLGFTAVAVWVVWDQFRKLGDADRWFTASLALIASGAVGNAVDRVWKQTVTDFIRVYTENPSVSEFLRRSPLGSNEWPSFNVADSVLLVGVVIFFVVGSKNERQDAKTAEDQPRAAAGE